MAEGFDPVRPAYAASSALLTTLDFVKHPPTDYDLLRAIYERHRPDYQAVAATSLTVPIDLDALAADLGTEPQSIFGRLYHHLSPLYEVRNPDGSKKALFIARGDQPDLVNFPVLEAALAALWQERSIVQRTQWLAIASLVVAVASLLVSVLT